MSSIRLSPKHGVNPSLLTCFWCQKNSTGIALVGRLKNDAQAPDEMLDTSYTPCDECKTKFDQGVTLFEATQTPNFDQQPPIQEQPVLYPTGRTITFKKPEILHRIFTPDIAKNICELKKGFIQPEAMDIILSKIQRDGADEK